MSDFWKKHHLPGWRVWDDDEGERREEEDESGGGGGGDGDGDGDSGGGDWGGGGDESSGSPGEGDSSGGWSPGESGGGFDESGGSGFDVGDGGDWGRSSDSFDSGDFRPKLRGESDTVDRGRLFEDLDTIDIDNEGDTDGDGDDDIYDQMRRDEARRRRDQAAKEKQEAEQKARDDAAAAAAAAQREADLAALANQGEGLTPAEQIAKAPEGEIPLTPPPNLLTPFSPGGPSPNTKKGEYGVGVRSFIDEVTNQTHWIDGDGAVYDNAGNMVRSYRGLTPEDDEAGRVRYESAKPLTPTAPTPPGTAPSAPQQPAENPPAPNQPAGQERQDDLITYINPRFPDAPVTVTRYQWESMPAERKGGPYPLQITDVKPNPSRPEQGPPPPPPPGLPPKEPFVPPNARPADNAPAAAAGAAAGEAASTTAAAGGTPDQVAAAAEGAARAAYDKQTLAQQSAWTRAAFRSQYGERDAEEWARQHNAELDRNTRLYGSREPKAGTPALAGTNAPAAPDRRIGVTPPPGPGESGRYGINWRTAPAAAEPAKTGPVDVTSASALPGTRFTPGSGARVVDVRGGPDIPGTGQPAESAAARAIPLLPPPPAASNVSPTASANVANPQAGEPPARGNIPPAQEPAAPAEAPSAPSIPPPARNEGLAEGVSDAGEPIYTPPPYTGPTGGTTPVGPTPTVGTNQSPLEVTPPTTTGPELAPRGGEGVVEHVPTAAPVPSAASSTSTTPPVTDELAPRTAPGSPYPPVEPIPGLQNAPMEFPYEPRTLPPEVAPPVALVPASDADVDALFAGEAAKDIDIAYPRQDQMSVAEKWANCGPIAAMAFAQSQGLEITYDQALAAAKRAGWTMGGMAGPPSMVTTMRDLGIDAETGPIDLARIRAEIDAGRPVMLSSPGSGGHYFVVQGVDDNGVLNLGNSALALRASGGRTHFTLDQMKSQLGSFGQVDTAIYIKSKPGGGPAWEGKPPAAPTTTPPPSTITAGNREPMPGAPDLPPPVANTPAEGKQYVLETALTAIDTPTPVNTVVSLAGTDANDPQAAQKVTDGMAQLLAGDAAGKWTEPYLNDVARLAWAREERTNGRTSDPRMTPTEYIEKWKDAFYGADRKVALVGELYDQIHRSSAYTPGKVGPRTSLSQMPTGQVGRSPDMVNLPERNDQPGGGIQTLPVRNTEPQPGRQNYTLPAQLQGGKVQTGLQSGPGANPSDQMATVHQRAFDQSGDMEYADSVAELLVAEGGLTGTIGDQGRSSGPYQFYWGNNGIGEGHGFQAWLSQREGRPVGQPEAMQLAKNIDLANEYYLPKLRQFYDRGRAMGYEGSQAIAAGGHNSGAPRVPEVWQNYANARRRYRSGNFTGGTSLAQMSQKSMNSEAEPFPESSDTVSGHVQGEVPPWEEPGYTNSMNVPLPSNYIDPSVRFTPEGADRLPELIAPTYPDSRPPWRYGDDIPYEFYREPISEYPGDNPPAETPSPTTEGMRNVESITAQRAIDAQAALPWYQEADPDAVTYVGEGRGRDVGAKFWTIAYDIGGGDATFANVAAGIVNGEGGFSGRQDRRGAVGLFQFDSEYEKPIFAKWLRDQGINEPVEKAAGNIELAARYYLPILKEAYDRVRAQGVTDERQLVVMTAGAPSSRGYGHNAGTNLPAIINNYQQGLEEFKRGQFRLLDARRW